MWKSLLAASNFFLCKAIKVFCCFFIGFFWFTSIIAAAPIDISLSPASAYVQVDGGESKFVSYQLENQSEQTLNVTLQVESFAPDGKTGEPQLLGRLDYPGEIHLHEVAATGSATRSINLLPKSKKTVYVLISPPLGIPEQEYPLTLLFHFRDLVARPGTSEVQLILGSNLIVSSAKSNHYQNQLYFQNPPLAYWHDSFFFRRPLEIKVINGGNFSALIAGELSLKTITGELVESWQLHPDLVLGKSSRLARERISDIGSTNLTPNYFLLPKFLFGEYILEGTLVSGYQQSVEGISHLQVHFYAFPFVFLVFSLLALALISCWLVRRRRKRFLQKLKRAYRQHFQSKSKTA